MNKEKNLHLIPIKERKELRNHAIRSFYRRGYSMDDIVEVAKQHPEWFYTTSGISKTTIFFAINGRSKKKVEKDVKN